MALITHPFAVAEPGDVPLPSAPLVRTIAQVRFPHLTQFSINEDAVAAGVAAALVEQYPIMEVGQEVSVTITPEGVSESRSPSRLWRLTSADRAWQVSFSGTSLSIDTTKYARRSDFAQRLSDAWIALNMQVSVPYIQRMGVRYINQISDLELLHRLPELLRSEVLGICDFPVSPEANLASALTQAQYQFPDGAAFMGRWGLLPAGTAIDSESPAHDYPTWVLDMDSFRESPPMAHTGDELYEDVRGLALRGYQFFRWAVTEQFLTAFGGQP